ncbi:hypothetical protein EDB81DRAFT_903034 [Dactylonectria macrodidyma]|uniref:RRM domain-containing protein n=1 Tax=Dactylonectria macrodidyma TaxID=307937 RepID=A0A9P9EBR0_9HYPO|nr:hypothetical protein EDB81DRAFT_903034 [Dactylonectria macrodidyma]
MDRIVTTDDDILKAWTPLQAPRNHIEHQPVSVASALKNATGNSENRSSLSLKEDHERIDAKLQFIRRSGLACFGELQQLKMLDNSSICNAPSRDSRESMANPSLSPLKYHKSILADGINQICKPTAMPESRLVILGNLPTNIPLSQVVKGVRGAGGLLFVGMFPYAHATVGGKSTTALQFRFASTAAAYAKMIRENPIYYLDAKGDKHCADFQLVQTSSFPAPYTGCPINGRRLPDDSPSGRCVQFSYFPQSCVWDFISQIGLSRVINVSYIEVDNVGNRGLLTVELSSSFDARHICRKVQDDGFEYYSVGGEMDGNREIRLSYCESDCPDGLLETMNGRCIPHVPVDHLTLKWNEEPWNSTQGISSTLKVLLREPETFCNDTSCAPLYYLGARYYIRGREVRKQHRRNEACVKVTQDGIEAVMSATLHNPAWAAFWDEHFAANETINLRKYDEYAAIANHRRQKVQEQGLKD